MDEAFSLISQHMKKTLQSEKTPTRDAQLIQPFTADYFVVFSVFAVFSHFLSRVVILVTLVVRLFAWLFLKLQFVELSGPPYLSLFSNILKTK